MASSNHIVIMQSKMSEISSQLASIKGGIKSSNLRFTDSMAEYGGGLNAQIANADQRADALAARIGALSSAVSNLAGEAKGLAAQAGMAHASNAVTQQAIDLLNSLHQKSGTDNTLWTHICIEEAGAWVAGNWLDGIVAPIGISPDDLLSALQSFANGDASALSDMNVDFTNEKGMALIDALGEAAGLDSSVVGQAVMLGKFIGNGAYEGVSMFINDLMNGSGVVSSTVDGISNAALGTLEAAGEWAYSTLPGVSNIVEFLTGNQNGLEGIRQNFDEFQDNLSWVIGEAIDTVGGCASDAWDGVVSVTSDIVSGASDVLEGFGNWICSWF